MNETGQLRQECWTKTIHCLATSYIFQKKSQRYEKFIRYNSILGLIVPLLIGAIAGTYGANSEYLKYAILVVAPFSILQIMISGLSLANKWDHNLSYSLESQTDNRILSEEFKKLAKYPPAQPTDLTRQFEILSTKDNERTRQDEKISFSDKENRKGMRYALMILQIPCAICTLTPTNMTSTDCTNCGKF